MYVYQVMKLIFLEYLITESHELRAMLGMAFMEYVHGAPKYLL